MLGQRRRWWTNIEPTMADVVWARSETRVELSSRPTTSGIDLLNLLKNLFILSGYPVFYFTIYYDFNYVCDTV